LVRIHGENPLGLYEEITDYLAKKWKTIGLKTQIAKVPDTIVNGCEDVKTLKVLE